LSPFYLDDFLLLAATMEGAVKNTQLVVTPSVSRFYNKPQEIITDSNSSDNLLGFPNRLNMHDDITPGRKGLQNSTLLSQSAYFSKYQIAKPSSHLASSTTLSSLAVRSDKGPTNEPGVLTTLWLPCHRVPV